MYIYICIYGYTSTYLFTTSLRCAVRSDMILYSILLSTLLDRPPLHPNNFASKLVGESDYSLPRSTHGPLIASTSVDHP